MPFIVRYRPITDQYSSRRLSVFRGSESLVLDLCEIDGWVYASCADDVDLSEVDPAYSAEAVTLTADVRTEIKRASPHCRLIKARTHALVAQEYDGQDQTKLDRLMAAAGAGLVALTDSQRATLGSYRDANLAADQWAAQQYREVGL
jgi:hypothetical protein